MREYLVDFNASAAARRSGYSSKTAHQIGYELLSKPEVVNAVQVEQRRDAADMRVSRVELLAGFLGVIRADLRAAIDEDGVPLPLHELPGELAQALVEASYDPATGRWKYKLEAKGPARDSLAKHLGLFERDNQQRGAAAGEAAARTLAEGMSALEVARRVAWVLHRGAQEALVVEAQDG